MSRWVGTNDTGATDADPTGGHAAGNNMVQVSGYVYDNGTVGDDNLTQETDSPGGTAAARVIQFYYDWRDRLVATKAGVQGTEDTSTHRPILYADLNNWGQATDVSQFDGDGVTVTFSGGVPQKPAANLLRAYSTAAYDDQGRPYATNTYSVDQSNGTVSTTSLATNDYYDHRGYLVATSAPGGLWTKQQLDGAGRLTVTYATDGAGGTTWAAATTAANDTVLEQQEQQYDADGNVIESIDRQRFDSATGLGPLGSPTSGVGARVYYTASYYDNADRLTADVDVGTNGGAAWTRPGTVPTGSSTVLVTGYAYNAAGLVSDVTDPAGIDAHTNYDGLGRVTQTIAAYTNGVPTNSNNQTTNYTYDGDDNVLTVTAVLPGGAQQETQYVYGVTPAGGSTIASNDVLAAVEHPDPTTGNPSTTLEDTYTVNALSQPLTATDRNGNVHTYSYDVLGRLTADAITTLGPGVDGSVRRLEIAYDTGGRPYLFTSFDAPSGGNVVNQVQRAYNGLGQLTTEYQSHSGTVNTSSTPNVQYGYTLMAGGANNSRLTSLTYPSSYVVTYNYSSGLNNTISRLSSISDSTATLESYKYLGLGTVVERDHPQPNVNLTYLKQFGDGNANGDGGDQYTGLDRFGRIIDQFFVNGTGQAVDRNQYGYDQDSNVLYAANLVDAAFSNLYQYNPLNELTGYQRGTLNSTRTGLVGNPTDSQSWSLDALGNWASVTTNGTQETRTHNAQNELTSQNGTGLTYDANGNTTQDAAGNKYIYDAWNRLVKVTASNNTVLASYTYDALGRRITETHGTTTTDLYYSAAWQVLEERVAGVVQARNVWSPAGIDTLVLRDQSSQHNGILDQRLYVLQDPNGNVMALVDASGNVLERYAYQPFGTFIIMDANWNVRSTSSYGWLYYFQGKRYDGAVNLYDSRIRDYGPAFGRSMQQDPLGFAARDANFYRYVGNAPTALTDPSGLESPALIGSPEWWQRTYWDVVRTPQPELYIRRGVPPSDRLVRDPGQYTGRIYWDRLTGLEREDLFWEWYWTTPQGFGQSPLPRWWIEQNIQQNRGPYTDWNAMLTMGSLGAGLLSTGGGMAVPATNGLRWTSWQNLPRTVVGGTEYAQIGGRLYTQHAIERMMPSGLSGYGRSVAPAYVEMAIQTGTRSTQVVNGVTRTIYTSGSTQVVTEQCGQIIVTVVTH